MATSRHAKSSSRARSRCSLRFTAARPRTERSPRRGSRSTSRVTLSPTRRETARRFTSPERIGRPPAVSGSPASRKKTANPAHCASAVRQAASETSASDAARTCAKPRSERYPTPPSATTSTAPGHGSSGCSDSSSTATKDAKAATSELENPPSKPSGPQSSSTSTQSEPPSEPRPHKRNSQSSEQHQRHNPTPRPGANHHLPHGTFSAVTSITSSLELKRTQPGE